LEKMKMQFDEKDWMDIDELTTSQKPGHQKLVKFMTQLPVQQEQPKPAEPAKTTPTSSTSSSSSTTAMEDASDAATKQLAAAAANKRKGKRDVPNADEDDESADGGEQATLKKQHTIAMEASESEVDKECMKVALEQIRIAQMRSARAGMTARELYGECIVTAGKRQ
jgi:hypothetical protein